MNIAFSGFVRSICIALCFLSSADQSVAEDQDTASYPVLSGVGIALRQLDGEICVAATVPLSPAAKSGRVRKGDCIVAVDADGKKTLLRGKAVGEAASLIRGPSGTTVTLTLERAGADSTADATQTRVTLTRTPLKLSGVSKASYKSLVGKPAPDLVMSTLDGDSAVKLSDYVGKIVVLEFWATWCRTCYAPVTEMQDIVRRNRKWQDHVEVLVVSVDSDRARAANVAKKMNWNRTTNLSIGSRTLEEAGISVLPVTMIVAADGAIAAMAASHAIDVEREVNTLLEGPDRGKPGGQ